MAKAVLVCGKICSGKTYYAMGMMKHNRAVLLSADELISALFHPDENEYHDKVINNAHEYLLKKSIEILNSGVDVILDWGFWTRKQREDANAFYNKNNIKTQWHYLDIKETVLQRNIEKRNIDVLNNKTTDYYVDQGLSDKLNSLFEKPHKEEIDVWVNV